MERSSNVWGYECKINQHKEPELFPQEEVYIKILNVKFVDDKQSKYDNIISQYILFSIKKKEVGGNLLLTTLRVLWYKDNLALEVPLFYVKEFKKGGGLFKSQNIKLVLHQPESHSQYMIEYHSKILRLPGVPYKPRLNADVVLKFYDSNRDKFIPLLNEALQQRHWNQSIKITATPGQLVEEPVQQQVQRTGGGISAIKSHIEQKTKMNQNEISTAFQDLSSLKEKAKGLVSIANQIQNKIKKKELNADAEEMKEIQSVMFNMGLITDFSSQVSKDLAGKNYYMELAREVEKFSFGVLDKFGGVLALIDIYCMYNRARGTDLISPEDLLIAQHFNQESYFQKLVKLAQEQPGLTADRMASILRVNVILMKEQLRYYESARYFSSQKDMLISQLQSEIFELRGKGNNYNKLRDNMMEIEQAYRRLLEDKGNFEDGLRSKIDHGLMESNHLQHEVETLRHEITFRSKSNADVATDIQRLRQINIMRDDEIYNCEADLHQKSDHQLALKNDLEDLVYEVSQLREERSKFNQENMLLVNEGKISQEKLLQLSNRGADLQHQIKNEQEKQSSFEKTLDERDREVARKNDALFSTQAEINRCKELCDELRKRESSILVAIQDKDSLNKDSERQYLLDQNKLTQLRMDVDTFELENNKQDKHLDIQRRDNETVKQTNSRCTENNLLLRDEIAALTRHQTLLDEQNRALVIELEKFAQTDEHLKNTLDRRRRIQDMKDTMHKQLEQSHQRVLRSPVRQQ
ncbi:vacuolar protein-sorting-associated protein 36 [Stylonychia lemnae]|uniref:Vacuolar protein-sorting-associated protein 36 n=1 Tax=Stylonychia lemnae TaxID=5949 RepID=A0A077ZWD8_STYLE|nr:vacuolar protein-sorting-associated protein 36 [Stylonychia lemnae]|eukprot:CDW73585.1 vacuolar protein-sorting-associated protein 36 [Stylonychia lemnae]